MSGAQINLLEEIIVDNFAGGGGASTGIELATGRPVTISKVRVGRESHTSRTRPRTTGLKRPCSPLERTPGRTLSIRGCDWPKEDRITATSPWKRRPATTRPTSRA